MSKPGLHQAATLTSWIREEASLWVHAGVSPTLSSLMQQEFASLGSLLLFVLPVVHVSGYYGLTILVAHATRCCMFLLYSSSS
jgi:hypothetical protein